MQNGLCLEVKTEFLIPNCLYYIENGNCETCEEGYYLNNNDCLMASAMNCLTYKDIDTCESCKTG